VILAAILWVKTMRNVCHCDSASIRFDGKLVIMYLFLFVEKVHMKETKQMTLQLDRKVHDSNTCPTLKHKNTLKNKNTNIQKHE